MLLMNTVAMAGRKVYKISEWPDDETTAKLIATGVLVAPPSGTAQAPGPVVADPYGDLTDL